MAIRLARLDDLPSLLDGARRMHAVTRFQHLPFSDQRVEASFRELIEKGASRYAFLVATSGSTERIVGALIGVLERHIFSEALTASVMHFDVLPEARMGGHAARLLMAFEGWCKNRGVTEIAFGTNSGHDERNLVGRFAVKAGYERVGENYVKPAVRTTLVNSDKE
jgi:GNAT superfamily N-acetyltransferase